MRYIFLLLCTNFYGQVLHHEMISSQGKSTKLSNGTLVRQIIGQQSITGNSTARYVVQQGFLQNNWAIKIAESDIKNAIIVTTYPNPFVSIINFEFSKLMDEEISISIFDINGRLIFDAKKKPTNIVTTIDLSMLPASTYLVRLKNSQINKYIKILKTL